MVSQLEKEEIGFKSKRGPASAQKGHADSSFFRFLEIFDRFFDLIVSTRAIACWKEQTHAIPL